MPAKKKPAESTPVARNRAQVQMTMNEVFSARKHALQQLMGEPIRDLDREARYPVTIRTQDYRYMWDREGIAGRVVGLFPDESWRVKPIVYETERNDIVTDFEKSWNELKDRLNIYHYMHRVDELSGIGSYGVMLLGFDDGMELSAPVEGINEVGEKVGDSERRLLYIRVFDESLVEIMRYETDTSNPRFGYPTLYKIKFEEGAAGGVSTALQKDLLVHWSRVHHVADNRKSSEVYGVPRMQDVFNRLLDLKKILASSPEMFYKGGFMGLSIEVTPEMMMQGVVMDRESMQEEFQKYSEGLQRYMALEGARANPLMPQVSDPSPHFESQLKAIAISKGVPYRIFMGTEEGRLAGGQDTIAWNERVRQRQNDYLTPLHIRPFVDRMIVTGVCAPPAEENGFNVFWPDLHTATDEDKSEVADKRTSALAKYVQGNVDQIIALEDYLVHIHGMEEKVVKAITKNILKQLQENEGDEDEDEEEEEQ